MLSNMKRTRLSNSANETKKIGQQFVARLLNKREKRGNALVFALEGELGSGKTIFVQGLARGLGIKQTITSPTFILIRRYFLPRSFLTGKKQNDFRNFYHIDCYRLEKPWQLQELEFNNIINDAGNIVAIEWADKIKQILPPDSIRIKFELLTQEKRRIIFTN